ncbi:MAG: hypothetical protein ACOCVF_01600 [bacterium]
MNKYKININGFNNVRITINSHVNEKFECVIFHFNLEFKSEFIWKTKFERIIAVFNDEVKKEEFDSYYKGKFYDGNKLLNYQLYSINEYDISEFIVKFYEEFSDTNDQIEEKIKFLYEFEKKAFDSLSGATELYFEDNEVD